MRPFEQEELSALLRHDNPWWAAPGSLPDQYERHRAHFPAFRKLAAQQKVPRSIVLMGPRRVGKTVMLKQLIQTLLDEQYPPGRIFFASLESAAYRDLPLERILMLYQKEKGCGPHERSIVIFDEIQYCKDWEIDLKNITDRYPAIRFIASGSATAALRMKSRESGAGRFTDFTLPPLTFSEFLEFRGLEDRLMRPDPDCPGRFQTTDIDRLNACFIDYLNYGGYPEAALNPEVREQPARFLREDVIGRVLAPDLPTLYGIQNVPEMQRLLKYMAHQSGQEISLQRLAENSGASKNTIVRHLEYLEAAFLILRVRRVDDDGKTFRRIPSMKAYLANPAMRTFWYEPLAADGEAVGHQAEAAVFSQWAHSPDFRNLYYAHWRTGRAEREVDWVMFDPDGGKPRKACEIKWSNRYVGHAKRLPGLIRFAKKNGLKRVEVTSRTRTAEESVDGISVAHIPCALYCHATGLEALENQARTIPI